MPTAFVLVNSEVGQDEEVLKELRKVEGVREAYFVYGVYDVVVKVEADTMDTLKDIVTGKIRRMKNVRSTLTITVIS